MCCLRANKSIGFVCFLHTQFVHFIAVSWHCFYCRWLYVLRLSFNNCWADFSLFIPPPLARFYFVSNYSPQTILFVVLIFSFFVCLCDTILLFSHHHSSITVYNFLLHDQMSIPRTCFGVNLQMDFWCIAISCRNDFKPFFVRT